MVSQNPKAGTSVSKGSSITIYVSGGGTQVPSVIGDPLSTAQQILSGAGFNVSIRTVQGPSGSTPGNVFSQNPSGGTAPAGHQGDHLRRRSSDAIADACTPSPTATCVAVAEPERLEQPRL